MGLSWVGGKSMGHLPEERYTEPAKKNSSLSFTLSFFCDFRLFVVCTRHQIFLFLYLTPSVLHWSLI
uniref:Uncharacterized protein n=1 Tax=Picea sitchensis TaxID=3332 RepID=D5A8P7_PICSI|nr:unknown [Picea sitchensis]